MPDDTSKDSLLAPDKGQMELLPSDQLPDVLFFEDEHPSDGSPRKYTAARFFKHHPEEYAQIVSLMAEEHPIEDLARRFKVSKHTIYAIQARETAGAVVARLKQQAATRYRSLARLSSDVLREVLVHDDAIRLFAKNPEKLAILIGILEDKAELLSGGATQRVEIVDQADVYRTMLDHARKMMGCEGDLAGQKGPGPAAPADGAPGGDGPVIEGECSDVKEA